MRLPGGHVTFGTGKSAFKHTMPRLTEWITTHSDDRPDGEEAGWISGGSSQVTGQALERFLDEIPDADRTFLKEDVADPDVVAAWVLPGDARSIALDDGDIVGYVAVIPLHGWSRHVGEVRIVVDPDHRGRGVGQALARHAVLEALELGVAKLVVEVIADQEALIAMFVALGFEPEALLIDHVRDRSGELRDLLVLAHSVADQWASMAAAGIVDSR